MSEVLRRQEADRRLIWFELVMGALAAVSVWLAVQPDTNFYHRLSMAIWLVFVVDYGARLLFARRKLGFIRANWIDLIAILPGDLMRGLRLIRMVRVFRFVRGIGVLWRTSHHVRGVLRTNGLIYALGLTVMLVIAAGYVIPQVEPGIGTPADGIWWSLVTATTVGYGDIAPRTHEGRLIAAILMLVGIGTIGMITGSIATYFMGVQGSRNPHVRHLQRQLDDWDGMSPEERLAVARLVGALARENERDDAPAPLDDPPS